MILRKSKMIYHQSFFDFHFHSKFDFLQFDTHETHERNPHQASDNKRNS